MNKRIGPIVQSSLDSHGGLSVEAALKDICAQAQAVAAIYWCTQDGEPAGGIRSGAVALTGDSDGLIKALQEISLDLIQRRESSVFDDVSQMRTWKALLLAGSIAPERQSVWLVPLWKGDAWVGSVALLGAILPQDLRCRRLLECYVQQSLLNVRHFFDCESVMRQTHVLESIFKTLDQEAVLVIDESLRVTYANDVASVLFADNSGLAGLSARQVFKKAGGKSRPGYDKIGAILVELEQLLKSRAVPKQNFRLQVLFREQYLSVALHPLTISESSPRQVVVALQDVTLLQHKEEQLNTQLSEIADQNRQWQAIYNGVQESIVLLDIKGKILSLNPATERITKRTSMEVIGKHVGELFPKVGIQGSGINFVGKSGLFQALDEGRPSDLLEAVVETKDLRHIWVNYTYTPLWDNSGKMIALVRVTSDVTSVKAVEQMKNDFVSIASHELRTPLGVMSGYLNLFLAGQLGPLTDDQHTFMERLYHATNDMAVLIEDLLNISRIEAGRLEVVATEFDVTELIQHTLDDLESRYRAKNILIRLTHPAKPIMLMADQQKIGQALTNVIDNAIKYTYDNGTITIITKLNESTVEVLVKDSGVGIKPQNITHVFEKFYRENNPLSIKEGGSGLGLYITRKLVELHGGTISVASKEQIGTTFTIHLPEASYNTKGLI